MTTEKFVNVDPKYFKKFFNRLSADGGTTRGALSNILSQQRARQRGVIASARLTFATNPTAADTLTIGTTVYEFCTAASPLVPGTAGHVGVAIGLSAAATLASLVEAINFVPDAVNVLYPQGANGPGSATYTYLNGGPSVFADLPSATSLRVQWALYEAPAVYGSAPTIVPLPGTPASTTLAVSISGSATAWSYSNLTNSASYTMSGSQDCSMVKHTVSAAEVTAGLFLVELPFVGASIIGDSTAQAAASIAGWTGIGAPTTSSPTTSVASGALPANTYYYKVTALTALGESTAGTERSGTIASVGQMTVNWTPVTGATGYKIYRSTSTGTEVFLAEVSGQATATYVDQGGAVPQSTLTPPAADTTGGAGSTVTVATDDGHSNPYYANGDVAQFLVMA